MPEAETSRSDRVNIDESVIHIYRTLTEDSDMQQSPFKTMKDVFMLAACWGYRRETRRALPSGYKNTIRKEVFTDNDFTLLKAIAIADTSDVEVLLQTSDILTIAEEYAHAGIYDLKAHLLDQSGRPLWNLVGLLNS